MNKIIYKIASLLLLAVFATSCGMDNYDAPESKLYGQILYKDASGVEHPLQVKGTGEAIKLSLYQYGWQLSDGITLFANQEAKFEAVLFNGDYHMITNNNNGPWKTVQISEAKKDTVDFTLKGSTEVKIYVTPFFMIENAAISLNGTAVSATCDVKQIIPDATVNTQSVFISSTQFVDEQTNFVRVDFNENKTAGNKNFSFNITDAGQLKTLENAKNRIGKVYARIGVKAEGADQFIYSEVFELSL